MDIPNPREEFLASFHPKKWTVALFDSFSGEYTVLSRHDTEQSAMQEKKSRKDDEVVVLPPAEA